MFTTDTRKDHCPIRIMYGEPSDHHVRDRPLYKTDRPLAVIKATEFSDYSGGSVERSNHRAMLANEDMAPHLVRIIGSHGYEALAYDATLGPVPSSWDIANALDGFENHYPLFDDDDHSTLKSDLEAEAWDDHGRPDFRKTLTELLYLLDDGHDHELPDDEEPAPTEVSTLLNNAAPGETWKSLLNGLWSQGCDAYNVNGGYGYNIETGGIVHFYVGIWCSKAKIAWTNKLAQHAAMNAILVNLAEMTRLP